jgi:hypothetical protein
MAEEPKATNDTQDVPDVVLEELLAAFSTKEADAIDFDDPAIDRMLGLRQATAETNVAPVNQTGGWTTAEEPPADSQAASAPPAPGDGKVAATEPAQPATTAPSADHGQADRTAPEVSTDDAAPGAPVNLIVIGDDDLPDAVYLDEESGARLREVHAGEDDSSGGRSTIIIKDLDESGSIEALPAR